MQHCGQWVRPQSIRRNEENTSMRNRTLELTLVTLLGLALFAGVAWGQDEGREFHWSGKLAADQLVQVKGVNGNIDAEGSGGDQIDVTADKSGPDASRV